MTHLRRLALTCLLTLFLFTNAVPPHAGAAAGALATVETSRWIEGWNAHDARALGELLTDDVDFVLVNGTLVRGRQDFTHIHAQQFAGRYRNSVFRNDGMTDESFIRPDVAVVHWRWSISGVSNGDGSPAQTYHGIFTWVLVKNGGIWAIRVAQNTITR